MLSTGLIPKILTKIQEARRPDRFTQDFLSTKLRQSGGSAQAIIPLLKRMSFLSSDGAPTELYDQFRNETTQGEAIASGIRNAFDELYSRNEYAHEMPKDKLIGLITEITGSSKTDRTTKAIVGTFFALNEIADFDTSTGAEQFETTQELPINVSNKEPLHPPIGQDDSVGFNVSYTINLNLPETTNPDVFNAIFKSLKENLLKT